MPHLLLVATAGVSLAGPSTALEAAISLEVKLPSINGRPRHFALAFASRSGTEGQVRLNGVPLVDFDGEAKSDFSSEAGSWLFAGENAFEITIARASTTSEPDARPALELSLHAMAEPGFPEDENKVWGISVEGDGQPDRKTYVFALPDSFAPPSELLKKAAVVETLSDEDKTALTALAKEVLTTVTRGDLEAMNRIWAFKAREESLLQGNDPAQATGVFKQLVELLPQIFAGARLADSLDFTQVVGNRVVLVAAKDDSPAIQVSRDDGSAHINVFAAKIDGRWTLVR